MGKGNVSPEEFKTAKKSKASIVTASFLYKPSHGLIRQLLLKAECCEKCYLHYDFTMF